MEAITGFFTFLILLAVLLLFGGVIYKCRGDVANWLNARSAPANYSARKLRLVRDLEDAQVLAERKAEDVKTELTRITEKEKAAEAKVED